ncbi:helix-turn-helix transcriptional regulator [Streptomyces sp. BB1-1-1]|uniref:helix-turn-helix domain-containing protein n=1 Tax=Streptomyces sp. BB1-1-1 TaxID=3074430 RepID=UPI002877FA15|nr:helix-turn-helix transcriptional regulator [Streptomyces sp. BB1-1-1]WND37129.1 helix-turn-helix transcriptional regulator [Streptomyces sp. BB1-1-1]
MAGRQNRNQDLDPFTSPRTFFGSELRRAREAAGLSQDQLGERVFCSGTYIGQFESATRRPQPDLSKLLDDVLDTGEHFQRLCELARKSKHADYFADAAELETRAKTISEYAPMLVPGLLQTEAYARALTKATLPYGAADEVERYVRARVERQRILSDPTGPLLWQIVHEAALRVPVGGADVMAEQLAWLGELARTRGVLIQVHPYGAGPHTFMMGVVSLMTFRDAPPVAYVEGPHSGQLIEDPALVERYQTSYDLARAAALPPEASLTLIESVAEDLLK